MKRKKTFVTPRILGQTEYGLETSLLGGSNQYNTVVVSMGQAVETHDFASDDSLESYWE